MNLFGWNYNAAWCRFKWFPTKYFYYGWGPENPNTVVWTWLWFQREFKTHKCDWDKDQRNLWSSEYRTGIKIQLKEKGRRFKIIVPGTIKSYLTYQIPLWLGWKFKKFIYRPILLPLWITWDADRLQEIVLTLRESPRLRLSWDKWKEAHPRAKVARK